MNATGPDRFSTPADDGDWVTPQTLLFVPGDRPERFAKAAATGADAVIIDWEDSVRAANKVAARNATQSWLLARRGYVRVNAWGTADFDADLDMLAGLSSCRNGLAAIVLPKAENSRQVDDLIERMPSKVKVIALIESAVGLLAASSIAEHSAVALLAFGNLDFAADCGLTVEGPAEWELLPARAQLTYASRAAGLPGPIDGVTADVADERSVHADSTRAVRLGFSGKLCIHPRQVPIVTKAFAPAIEQIEWATRILNSVSEGVGLVDGTMVDRPVILRAQQILSRSTR